MSWRIIHITNVEQMSLHQDSLKVKRGDDELKIPLGDIFSIIIEDLTAKMTGRLMVELSKKNILVLLCGQKHLPEAQLLPISGHFGQMKRIRQQINWDEEKKGDVWKTIIEKKIFNQIKVMTRVRVDQQRINMVLNLLSEVDHFDASNCEARAAKIYFNSLFEFDFNRGNDQLLENAALDYGYTILNSAIARTVAAKGLIPSIGIFHKGERNHYNLASDLIEPFRPVVDLFVRESPPEDMLTYDYRMKLINLMHARILIDGKLQTMIRAIDVFTGSIIDYFDNKIKTDQIKLPDISRIAFHEL